MKRIACRTSPSDIRRKLSVDRTKSACFLPVQSMATTRSMRRSLIIISLLCGLTLGGCKRGSFRPPGEPHTDAHSCARGCCPVDAHPNPDADSLRRSIRTRRSIVFGYHRFEKKVRRPDTEITPEAFEAQMQKLQDAKIAVIGMQDFLCLETRGEIDSAEAAIITIDDGYKSGYEVAWPILKKFNYPLTLFIYTEGVKGGKYGGGEAMSWEQLAEMRDAGVDIEAHSATHQDLRKPYDRSTKRRLNPQEYTDWLNAEVGGSKATLEQKLGIKRGLFRGPVWLLQRSGQGSDQGRRVRGRLHRLWPKVDLRFA